MANLRVSDRILMVDEIIRRLQENLPEQSEVLKKAIKEEGLEKSFEAYEKIDEEYKEAQILVNKLEEKKRKAMTNLEVQCGFQSGVNWLSYNLTKVETYLVSKYSTPIPTRKEVETALLLAQGGGDMVTLMNNVIEQLRGE